MNETKIKNGRFARLQTTFALQSVAIALPLIIAYFIFWQHFDSIVQYLSNLPDAMLLSSADRNHIAFRIYRCGWWFYVVALPSSLFGLFSVWLAAVIRKRMISDGMKSTARAMMILAFLSTGTYWFCCSLLLQFLARGLSGASDSHAQIAANAGVLPAKGSRTDIGISRTAKPIDKNVAKGRLERILFLRRTIESDATCAALARHYTGTLMDILRSTQDQTLPMNDWSKRELELGNAEVLRIGLLAGRTFPLPQESWGKYETSMNGEVVMEGQVMKSESQMTCRAALLEWWSTVADKPEWEPVPLYEIDDDSVQASTQ